MLGLPLYSFRVIEEDFGVVALKFVGQLLTGFRGEGLPDDGNYNECSDSFKIMVSGCTMLLSLVSNSIT